MKDITTRHDLEALMSEFYRKLLQDNDIGYIFTDVARINLDEHLPKIVDFWEQNILRTGSYRNNVLKVHLDLDDLVSLSDDHFKIWLGHLNQSINEEFIGPNAERMKTNALSIATVMRIKLQNKHENKN